MYRFFHTAPRMPKNRPVENPRFPRHPRALSRTSRALWHSSTARVVCGSTPWHSVSPLPKPPPILRRLNPSWQLFGGVHPAAQRRDSVLHLGWSPSLLLILSYGRGSFQRRINDPPSLLDVSSRANKEASPAIASPNTLSWASILSGTAARHPVISVETPTVSSPGTAKFRPRAIELSGLIRNRK